MNTVNPLDRYNDSAFRAATVVIRSYSTSFGTATRMLGKRHRQHVRNIYALVRVADELVDGVADEAGLDLESQYATLQSLEDETHRAMRTGYSSDLIIHAFAQTARAAAIDESLTQPFFDSMRADLPSLHSEEPTIQHYDSEQHQRYVHGSAEVIGLMCLNVFTRSSVFTPEQSAQLDKGARKLGAAFQNINFLRDLADDTERLGRSYLSTEESLTEADKDQWVSIIEADLAVARETLPLLPKDARAAVRSALNLFAALTTRVSHTDIDQLYSKRVRVSNFHKFWIVLASAVQTRLEKK